MLEISCLSAGENTPAPFIFEQIFPSTVASHTTHALPPQAVLQVYRQMEGTEPPPAFVLSVRGEKFELGEPLTAAAENHAEWAFEMLMGLCRQPMLAKWEAAATSIEQTSIN